VDFAVRRKTEGERDYRRSRYLSLSLAALDSSLVRGSHVCPPQVCSGKILRRYAPQDDPLFRCGVILSEAKDLFPASSRGRMRYPPFAVPGFGVRLRAHRSPTAAPTIFSLYRPPGAVENVAQDDPPFCCGVILSEAKDLFPASSRGRMIFSVCGARKRYPCGAAGLHNLVRYARRRAFRPPRLPFVPHTPENPLFPAYRRICPGKRANRRRG
jgi:hypothetical protein